MSSRTIQTLDVRSEICPYPQTMTKKKLSELQIGDQLEIILDYPMALETIPRWAEKSNHTVLGIEQIGNAEWKILLQKGASQ